MEANKENVLEKIETKIPLPLHPLPQLPIQLLKKKGKNTEKRQPLQTLAQENVSPSTSNAVSSRENSTTKILKNLDTKFVTLRQKHEKQNADYNIFKDHDEKITIISDDDEATDDGNIDEKNCRCERLAITPSVKQAEQLQVRNIKRSLRRPSSRELQGLSPPDKREKTQEESAPLAARRRLRFSELGETTDRFQSQDGWIKSYNTCLDHEYTEDLLNHLLATEQPPAPVKTTTRLTRACLINWLLKVNGPIGNSAIIQTACWFLDSILSTECVPLYKTQMVAAACYWIAQKLHGPVKLSSSFTKISANAFTQKMLLNAERQILLKLGFPRQPVVPQDYMAYLAWWCDKDRPEEIEVAANFICMSGLMVVKELGAVCPSEVACAAIGTAVIILRGKAAMEQIQDCPVYKTAETKAGNLLLTCRALRKAVRTVADPHYSYKAPIDHFGRPPHFIVQYIVNYARQRFSPPGEDTVIAW